MGSSRRVPSGSRVGSRGRSPRFGIPPVASSCKERVSGSEKRASQAPPKTNGCHVTRTTRSTAAGQWELRPETLSGLAIGPTIFRTKGGVVLEPSKNHLPLAQYRTRHKFPPSVEGEKSLAHRTKTRSYCARGSIDFSIQREIDDLHYYGSIENRTSLILLFPSSSAFVLEEGWRERNVRRRLIKNYARYKRKKKRLERGAQLAIAFQGFRAAHCVSGKSP